MQELFIRVKKKVNNFFVLPTKGRICRNMTTPKIRGGSCSWGSTFLRSALIDRKILTRAQFLVAFLMEKYPGFLHFYFNFLLISKSLNTIEPRSVKSNFTFFCFIIFYYYVGIFFLFLFSFWCKEINILYQLVQLSWALEVPPEECYSFSDPESLHAKFKKARI